MKPLSILGVAWALAATQLSAAPPSGADTDNPYSQFDPDGVPLAITQPTMRKRGGVTAEDMDNARKREEQAVIDSNWLLRAYEEQLRLHNQPTPTQSSTSDLYYQLSTNKDLAKLAGLPTTDFDQDPAQPRTGVTSKEKPQVALRSAPANTSPFQPLITPLSSTALGSTFGSSTTSLFSQETSFFGTNSAPARPVVPRPSRLSAESTDLDTPGAVADRNALPEPEAADLSLDLLPGETAEQARARDEMNRNPQLPVLMNADQLHAQQAALLKPKLPKGAQLPAPEPKVAVQPPVVKPVPADELPLPVGQGAQVTPVHAPIANPFDILNR
jgi:hypothetical protein